MSDIVEKMQSGFMVKTLEHADELLTRAALEIVTLRARLEQLEADHKRSAAVAAEREECAQFADAWAERGHIVAETIAAAIRARKEQKWLRG
jgi:hypothetical protein